MRTTYFAPASLRTCGLVAAAWLTLTALGCAYPTRETAFTEHSGDSGVRADAGADGAVDSGAGCVDDAHEQDDDLVQASARSSLPAGMSSYVSCPSTSDPTVGDDDLIRFQPATSRTYTITLTGSSVSDLDLYVTDASGTVLDSSLTNSSNEVIVIDLTGGTTYFVAVTALPTSAGVVARNPYVIDLQ